MEKNYVIEDKYFAKVASVQRETMLTSFNVNKKGNIVIPYKHKGYICNDRAPKFNNKIVAISFFSGAGGLDIGTQLAGIKVLSSLDIFEDSVKTLKLNKFFNGTIHECGDIMKIDGTHYSGMLKNTKANKLIVIGGPPCQPFSKAGYWVTNKKRHSESDPRNLILPYFKILSELKPDGFILENVESLLHPSNKIALDTIIEQIKLLGYNYSLLKINAAEYGIPQKRKRIFFLATKKKIEAILTKTNGSQEECLLNKSLKPYERVVDWIGRFDNEEYCKDENLSIEGKWCDQLQSIPFGKNYIALTEREHHPNPVFVAGKRYWSSLLKLDPTLPSWTIIASPGHWEGPFHWKNRRLNTRELAAIQTFPDDYIFYGSQASKRKQIGNAVPPLLAKQVVEELCKWL